MPVEIEFPDIGETVEIADDATESQIMAIHSDLLRSRAPRSTDSIPTVAPTGDPNQEHPSNKVADFVRRIPAGVQSGMGRTVKGGARAADIAQDPAPVQSMSGFGGVGFPQPKAIETVNRQVEQDVTERSRSRQSRMEGSLAFNLGREIETAAPGTFGVDETRDNEFLAQLATAAGEMFPTIAASVLAGPLGVIAQYGLSAGESKAQEAVDAGMPDRADIAFLSAAGLGGITEGMLGVTGRFMAIIKGARKAGVNPGNFGKWLNRNPIKGGIIRAAGKGSPTEAAQELLEEAGGNVIASDIAKYDPTRPLGRNVGRAAALGGVLGAGISGGGRGLHQANRNLTAQALKDTREGPLNLRKVAMLPHFEKATAQPYFKPAPRTGYVADTFIPRAAFADETAEALDQTAEEFLPEGAELPSGPAISFPVQESKPKEAQNEIAQTTVPSSVDDVIISPAGATSNPVEAAATTKKRAYKPRAAVVPAPEAEAPLVEGAVSDSVDVIEQAVAETNWRGTVRSVPAPRSMGVAGVNLYIPVDSSGQDVAVGGKTILGKTPKEAIELAQENVNPAPKGIKLGGQEHIAELKRQIAVEQKKLDRQTAKLGGAVPPPIVLEVSRKIAKKMAKIQDAIDFLEAKQQTQPKAPNEITTPTEQNISTPVGGVIDAPAGVKPPPSVNNASAIPAAEEGARWDALSTYQKPIVESLSGESLDQLANASGVKRHGLSDSALKEKIVNNTHPDDLQDAIDSLPKSETPKSTPKAKGKPKQRRASKPTTTVHDIIQNHIDNDGRKISITAARKLISDFKPTSARLRKLFSADKSAIEPDEAVPRYGAYSNLTDEEYLQALLDAEQVSSGSKKVKSEEAKALDIEAEKVQDFEVEIFEKNESGVSTSDLYEGSEFELDGEKMRVKKLHFDDESGDLAFVEIEDGRRFGTQTVGADRMIFPDKGTFKENAPDTGFAPEDPFSLEPAESVADQKARLASDKSKADEKARKDKLDALAKKPLKGTTGDLGQGDLLADPSDLWAPPSPKFGSANKLVSADRAEELIILIKDKLGRVSSGIDPTLLANLTELGVFYLEGGIRSFPAWSKAMIEQFGPQVRPWLRSVYEGARGVPGSTYEKEMSNYGDVRVLSEKYVAGEDPVEVATQPETPSQPGASSPDTGIKQSSITAQRAERGIEPLERGARQTWDAAREMALAKIAQDSTWLDTLQAEIADNPRPLDLTEIAGMEIRLSVLRQRYNTASDQMSAAHEAGREDQAQSLFQAVQSLSNQLRATEKAVGIGSAASEAGRRLGGLRMMMADDFTLAKMEQTWRDDHAGRSPDAGEFLALKAEHAKLQEALKTAEAAEAKARDAAAEAEARAVLAEVRAMESTIPPQVKRLVDRIGETLDRRADAARARLKGKLLSLSPADLKDLADIGAANIYHVGMDFARWSKAMIDELGEKVTPHLKDIFEAAKKQIDGTTDRIAEGKDKERVKKVVTKQDSEDVMSDLMVKIETKFKENDRDVTPLVQKLARQLVEDGISEREPLLDALHEILKTVDPEISRREVQDALTGYGKFTKPRQDPVSKTLADLKGQALETGKLLDLEAGEPLKPTGFLRGKMSDVRRRLVAQVNEAKKRFGIVPMDAAEHLATALETRKTTLQNRIKDLEAQIASREKFKKTRTPSPTDAEVESLIVRRDELKQQFDEIFGRPELTPEQRLKIATAAAERAEKSWQERLERAKAGKFGAPKSGSPPVTSPELAAIRARTEALRNEVEELRSIANPKLTPEQRALRAYNTRLANETAKLKEKLAAGDYTTTKRKPFDISKDAPTMKAKAEFEKLKNEWIRKGIETRQAAMKGIPLALDRIREAINVHQNWVSSGDLSALRQAKFIVLNPFHLKTNFQAIGSMLKGLSKAKAEQMEQEILNRPNSLNGVYSMMRLHIVPLNETNWRQQDESFRGRWAEKLPIIRASQRAFVTFLNRVRADTADMMYASTLNHSAKATRSIGRFINDATGYGDLGVGQLARQTDNLSFVIWSPRLLASRIRLLIGASAFSAPPEIRKLIAKEYAGTMLGILAMYQLLLMAGLEGEDDLRSSNFGKLKDGNVHWDPMGGLLQVMVFTSRLVTGQTKPTKAKAKIKDQPQSETFWNFLRSKFRPAVSVGFNAAAVATLDKPKDFKGELITPETIGLELLAPMSVKDILDVYEDAGIVKGTAYQIISIFGDSVSVYDEDRKNR